MTKLTLDVQAIKALASETRLDILKTLDGKKVSLKEVSQATGLSEVTVYEHLVKLVEAGLVKKNEREGHKWVFYSLSWKGKSLLHPENTKVVILFSSTIIFLMGGIISIITYIHSVLPSQGKLMPNEDIAPLMESADRTMQSTSNVNPYLLYLGIICFVLCCILTVISLWRYQKNKHQHF